MPKVPQLLPASSSQKREISENFVLLQLCTAGAVMVIVTGATASADEMGGGVGSGIVSAEAAVMLAAE